MAKERSNKKSGGREKESERANADKKKVKKERKNNGALAEKEREITKEKRGE